MLLQANISGAKLCPFIFNVSLLILLFNLLFTSSAAAFITGSTIRCVNEGEEVKVPFLTKDPSGSRIKCRCINQEIICKDPSLVRCTHNGRIYKSGETWKNGTCNKCTCFGGDISCRFENCDPSLKCPENTRLVHSTGDCCPSCVEKDRICSLTRRNPFTLTTFDQKKCSFEGVCNYVLVRDCLHKTFSVHLVHETVSNETLRKEEANDADRIMSVVVKVDQTKVRVTRGLETGNSSWKIRVGRRRPSLIPFIRLGVLSVVRNKAGILIRAHSGLRVTWDGRQDLRISLPATWKNRVCGLCGNFNSDPSDDLMTKKGKIVQHVSQFIESWKVGKKGICAAQKPGSYGVGVPIDGLKELAVSRDACSSNWKKKVEAMTACNILKANSFRPCHPVVPITSFYKNCVADMCSCEESKCSCASVTSYLQTCRGLGLKMQELTANWQTLTSCPVPDMNLTASRRVSDQMPKRQHQISSNSKRKERPVCPAGSVFTECASPCRRTCFQLKSECDRRCRPGCDCPPNMVWHESRCIKRKHCPTGFTGSSFRLKHLLKD